MGLFSFLDIRRIDARHKTAFLSSSYYNTLCPFAPSFTQYLLCLCGLKKHPTHFTSPELNSKSTPTESQPNSKFTPSQPQPTSMIHPMLRLPSCIRITYAKCIQKIRKDNFQLAESSYISINLYIYSLLNSHINTIIMANRLKNQAIYFHMKQLLTILSLASLTFARAQTNNTVTINVNGTARSYILYVPAIYSSATAVPLVFNFHGYGSNSTEQELYGEFRPIADTANFIIAHPQGLTVNGSTGWDNFGLPNAANADRDFVEAMITKISTDYSIDQNRIYSTGMSNGGFMSYDIACFLSEKFAAIASVTGGLTALHKNACQATHPTPVMQIHGTTDAVVAYNGGGTLGSLHVDSLVKFWRNFNQCSPTPTFTALPNFVTTDNCTAEHYVYSGGLNGSTVEFYKIIGGGHTWPGAIYPVNGNTNMDFSASKEIWRFFSQYKLNELTASVDEQEMKAEVKVYPNPSKASFIIEIEQYTGLTIEVQDAAGKPIHQQALSSKSTAVELNETSNGLYVYRIMNGKNLVKTGKIAVQ